MSEAENLAVVRRYVHVWGRGSPSLFDELVSPDVSFQYPLAKANSVETLKRMAKSLHEIFTDLSVRIDEELVDGDRVVMRWTQSGTYRGRWEHCLPPRGQTVNWTGLTIYRVVGGKIVDERGEEDSAGLLQMVGVLQEREPS